MPNELRTVRVVVLWGPEPLQRWEVDAITAAVAVPGVEVQATGTFVGASKEQPPASRSWNQRLFERMIRNARGSEMLQATPTPAIGEVEHLIFDPSTGTDRTSLAHLGSLNTDVYLLLGGAAREPGAFPPARLGTWYFASADGQLPGRYPPGCREALVGDAVSHFSLVDRDGARIRHGCFTTKVGEPFATADVVLRHAAQWPAQALQELIRTGMVLPFTAEVPPAAIPIPGDALIIRHSIRRWFAGRQGDRAGVVGSKIIAGDWNIGVLHQPIHTLLDENASANVRWFPPPSIGKSRMEPFGYRPADGELHVLYRKADNRSGHNAIARLRPKPDNILKRSRSMMDVNGQHAYPFTIALEGAPHVICTLLRENRTDLMRINATNEGFDPVATLLHHALHAPTLIEHNGRWWLMGTRDPLPDTALYLYHADSPLGPFTEHPMNPVLCDARSARPAGTPFVYQGVLWRPGLDATLSDGRSAIVLNKVVELSPDRFREEPSRRIESFGYTAYGEAVRTLCAMGDQTLVDGLRSPVLRASKANGSRRSGRERSKRKSRSE